LDIKPILLAAAAASNKPNGAGKSIHDMQAARQLFEP
jgi:hypothetical protein